MGRRWMRDFDRNAAATRKRIQADRLERLGLSDPMWNALQDLHLARLERERGRRAKMTDATLVALQTRGLATWNPIPGENAADGDCLWTATAEGAAMIKTGRPE